MDKCHWRSDGGGHSLSAKANSDASNLNDANVTSWKNKCSFKQIALLYDKDSSDSSINWGYTSGIQGSTTPITKDLTAYKSLLIYYQCYFSSQNNAGGNANCLIIDLERITDNYSIAGNEVSYFYNNAPNGMNRFSIQAKYNHSTQRLNFLFGYSSGAELANSQYYVYKIQGVY